MDAKVRADLLPARLIVVLATGFFLLLADAVRASGGHVQIVWYIMTGWWVAVLVMNHLWVQLCYPDRRRKPSDNQTVQ